MARCLAALFNRDLYLHPQDSSTCGSTGIGLLCGLRSFAAVDP